MKKILSLALCAALVLGLLSGCCLSHEWLDPTCETPKTCAKCEKTEGEALGHQFQSASCETAATCSRCDATQGEPLGHDWKAATCQSPETCSRCSQTQGGVTDHTAGEPGVLETDLVRGETMYEIACTLCGETMDSYWEPIASPIYEDHFWMTPEQFTVRLDNIFREMELDISANLVVNDGDMDGKITCDLTSGSTMLAYSFFVHEDEDLREGEWQYDEHCMFLTAKTDNQIMLATYISYVMITAIDPTLDLDAAADLMGPALDGQTVTHNGISYEIFFYQDDIIAFLARIA